jgi:hypothetical protein
VPVHYLPLYCSCITLRYIFATISFALSLKLKRITCLRHSSLRMSTERDGSDYQDKVSSAKARWNSDQLTSAKPSSSSAASGEGKPSSFTATQATYSPGPSSRPSVTPKCRSLEVPDYAIYDEDASQDYKRPKFSVERNETGDTRLMPPPSTIPCTHTRLSQEHACMVNPIPKEWTIGVHFEFMHNTAHRVYEGPPDGTPRVRLSSEELHIDFNKIYQVTGIYADSTWTAVSFEVIPGQDDKTLHTVTSYQYDRSTPPGGAVTVWTNVRKKHVWWAKPFLCRANHRHDQYPSASS